MILPSLLFLFSNGPSKCQLAIFNYALYKLKIESVIVILNHNIHIVLDEFSFFLFGTIFICTENGRKSM